MNQLTAASTRPAPRVLLVESSPNQRLYSTMALTVAGFDVTAVSDARLAVETAERIAPALVCIDFSNSDPAAVEACEALRERSATACIPVILTASRGTMVDRALAERAGADDMVLKPIDPIRFGVRALALIAKRTIAAA